MGSVASTAEDLTGLNVSGDSSSDRALAGQQAATQSSNALSKYMYDQNRTDSQPWRDAGVKALGQMQDPNFQHSFGASDFQADPGYQFRMDQAQKALERSSAAKGGLMSGGFAQALNRNIQDVATQGYQQARDNFTNDQSNRFGRLSQLAGLGQNAQSQTAQEGTNYANTVSNNTNAMANAQGAQGMAQAQQRGQMIMGGAALAFCDERLKTEITRPSAEDLAELRAALKPYAYRYKDESYGVGPWVGVMAQDLAKTKLGKTIVIPNADGHLQIDMNKAFSLCLAAIAEG